MFSKAIRAACYRELQVDVVNRHSRLELRNLHYHAASGQCVRPPSAAVLINSSSSATFGTDLAVTTCTGCMLYRLTQQTGAPLPSRLFLFIAWKITTGSHSCWLEVLEANYDAFPADKNELRRHFNQITMETSGEERGVLQRNILLPGDICFSVAAVMGDTKKTNMRIELYNGVFDTGSQLVTAPLVLMPFEEDEVFHLDPLKVTEQLPTHQEVAAALEQQLPTVMFYSEHNKVRLIDPFFNLQKGSLHSMPTNTTLFNGSFCQYLLQPANGRARGSMIYSLVAASSTSDAIFLASYMPITMYILVGWDVNINGCSRFYMDVVCTDSDLRIDEVIRRRVFSFALKEFERSNNDPTMIIGRRKFTGELLGVPFSISAYVRSPHPHSVFLEFTEDIGYRTLLKPVWLPSRNDFNHQTLTGAQQVAREKELSCLIGSVRQNTPRIIILVENTHPQVVLEQCDSGLYINSFNQSIIPRKIAPGEIVVATSQVNIENRIFSGHIIYKVHNAYTSTQSVNPPSSALSFIANHRDRNSSSPGRSSGKRFSVARAFKAAKSALSTRDTVVPESPISHIFLIINWAIVAGRQRLLFSAEYIATNNADFNDTSKAQNRYMLLVLTALTRSEQGNRMVHWAHASNGNEQPSERPKTSSRSSVVAESKMQLDPTLAVDSHMSLETIPVLSLGVRQSPVTTNQKPPVESALMPSHVFICIDNRHPRYQLVNGRHYSIACDANLLDTAIQPFHSSTGEFSIALMATRSVGIIIYDVVGDKGQILRDNPCFVIAWRSSCDYGRDLRFVANILQEKDTGYDGRSGLFSLPNLHSILFQQNTYDMKKTTQEKSNWFNEWTGLMNAGGVYTTSLDVSLLQCGKLVANVVFSNAIVGTIEQAEQIPELESSRLLTPVSDTFSDSRFDTATVTGVQTPTRGSSSVAFSTTATTAAAAPNLFLTIKNEHRDVVLERPFNYSMAGECTSVPETLLAGGYAVEVECTPANETDTPCAGFVIYSIGGADPAYISRNNGVYLVVGWRTRFSLQSGGSGEFFSNIVKIRLNENTRFETAAAAERFYAKLCGGRQNPLGKKVKRQVNLQGIGDVVVSSSMVYDGLFKFDIKIHSANSNGDEEDMGGFNRNLARPISVYSRFTASRVSLAPSMMTQDTNRTILAVPDHYGSSTTLIGADHHRYPYSSLSRATSNAPSLAFSQRTLLVPTLELPENEH